MKTLISIFALAFLLGCKSTEDIASKSTGVTIITAQAATSAWLDYKNTHAVPPEQVQRVKTVYEKYAAAMNLEKESIIAWKTNTDTNAINRAISISTLASSELIRTIIKFLPPSEVAKMKGLNP